MNCPYCGTAIQQGTTFCKKCGAAMQAVPSIDQMMGQDIAAYQEQYLSGAEELGYLPEAHQPMDYMPITVPKRPISGAGSRRGKPSLALRMPLQIFSFLLSILLLVCLLGTALLMDCNRMLSAAGIKQVVNAVFSVSQARPGARVFCGAAGAGVRMDDFSTLPSDVPLSEDSLSNVELPADILTSGNTDALVDWLCAIAQDVAGREVTINREQVQTFVEESTLTDYVAEKAAAYAQDFINGTQNTQITTQELMQLLEDNQDLIKSTFQVDFSPEMKQELERAIQATIEQNNLNELIHEQVFTAMEETLDAALPLEWEKIQTILQMLTSNELLVGAIGLCVLIMLLLCVLNFYNLPAGLTWSAVPCIFSGSILVLPVAVLQASPALLTDLLDLPGAVAQLILSFLDVFSLVHYGILAFGVVLLLLSLLWRIIRAVSRPAYAY